MGIRNIGPQGEKKIEFVHRPWRFSIHVFPGILMYDAGYEEQDTPSGPAFRHNPYQWMTAAGDYTPGLFSSSMMPRHPLHPRLPWMSTMRFCTRT